MTSSKFNRRQLLSAGVLVGSSVALDAAPARSISGAVPWHPGEANKPPIAQPGPRQFLTAEEASFIDAALARLIPSDELGPGAVEAGVTDFIDLQLAGPYGKGATWYMEGPWPKGQDTQGYQSRLPPAGMYRTAIQAIDAYAIKTYDGKNFAAITPEQQDALLLGLDKGDITLDGADGKAFMTMFWQNTLEGFFADPIYGGNRGMAGWRLIGFPGARYDYRPYIKKHNVKIDLPPVGLKGGPSWNPT